MVWRALNATTPELLENLSSLDDAALGIGGDAPRCTTPPDKLDFPVACDFFGRDFGGKSRNCRFWWLGRQCRIFYVPAAVYARPYVRTRIALAFSHPCRVLYGGTAKITMRLPLGSHGDMLDSFNRRDRWTVPAFEIRLHIIARDGSIDFTQQIYQMTGADGHFADPFGDPELEGPLSGWLMRTASGGGRAENIDSTLSTSSTS